MGELWESCVLTVLLELFLVVIGSERAFIIYNHHGVAMRSLASHALGRCLYWLLELEYGGVGDVQTARVAFPRSLPLKI